MGCAQGALSLLLVEAGTDPYTFDGSSEIYDFTSESIRKHGALVGGKGIAGTRSNFANRIREGSYPVGGTLETYTCPKDLDAWLPRILGGTEVADVFDVANGLPSFGILINRVSGNFLYDNCVIDKAMWVCRAGPGDEEPELLMQTLQILSLAEDSTQSWPGTIPTLSTASNRNPYICADGVLTIGGTAYQFHQFMIVVDNHVQPRWVNSLTPTALCPQDRTVALRALFPFTSADDAVMSGIYQNASRHTGVTATIVMTLTGVACSTTWTFTGLQWAQTTPHVTGKQEIVLAVDFVARRTGVASELVVTNDSAA